MTKIKTTNFGKCQARTRDCRVRTTAEASNFKVKVLRPRGKQLDVISERMVFVADRSKYREQLRTNAGLSGIRTRKYYVHRPQEVID